MTAYKFGSNSTKKLETCEQPIQDSCRLALSRSPINMIIVFGVRTLRTQQKLYAQGRTEPGKIVTYADGIEKRSRHQKNERGLSEAVDVAPYVKGAIPWKRLDLFGFVHGQIIQAAEELGFTLEWGGLWKWADRPHSQLPKGWTP